MIKFFKEHELISSIIYIVLYLVINSVVLQTFGSFSHQSAIITTAFSLTLLFQVILKGGKYYGFNGVKNAKDYLYFFPLILIASVNLWGGIKIDHNFSQTAFFIISMVNVAFAEELIFRGFLFKAMQKDNLKSAIIVSAVTFGIGHVINLFNGADIIPTLLQICYATAIGFLFVIIFYKSNSLIPCIITHALVNSLSVFNAQTPLLTYISSAILIIVPVLYTLYLCKKIK